MVVIPLVGDLPHYTQQVELDGATFGLELQWNFREEAWFLSLADGEGDAIASGLKLVVGFPLITRCKDSRMPGGFFQAQDTAGGDQDPGFSDLGSRVKLYYFSAGELI